MYRHHPSTVWNLGEDEYTKGEELPSGDPVPLQLLAKGHKGGPGAHEGAAGQWPTYDLWKHPVSHQLWGKPSNSIIHWCRIIPGVLNWTVPWPLPIPWLQETSLTSPSGMWTATWENQEVKPVRQTSTVYSRIGLRMPKWSVNWDAIVGGINTILTDLKNQLNYLRPQCNPPHAIYSPWNPSVLMSIISVVWPPRIFVLVKLVSSMQPTQLGTQPYCTPHILQPINFNVYFLWWQTR